MSEINEQEKPESSFGNLGKNAGILTNVIGVVTGSVSLFYALGYVVVNLRLLHMGVRDFALGNPAYLSAGISFMFFCSLFIIIPIWAGNSIMKIPKFKKNGELTIFFGISILSAICSVALLIMLRSTDVPSWNISVLLGLAANVVILVASGLYIPERIKKPSQVYDKAKETPFRAIIILGFIVPIAFLGMLLSWSNNIYPQISAGFGGGQPVVVQLVLIKDTDATLFTQIGINTNKNTTEQLRLLDDTGTTLIVLLPNGNAARVDKSLIANMLYISTQSASLLIATPTSTSIPSVTPTPP